MKAIAEITTQEPQNSKLEISQEVHHGIKGAKEILILKPSARIKLSHHSYLEKPNKETMNL